MKSSENITRRALSRPPRRARRARADIARDVADRAIDLREANDETVSGGILARRHKGTPSGGSVHRQASLRGIGAAAFDPFRLEQLGDEKGHFDRLLCIEPWIATTTATVMQVRLRDGPRAAGAFGDILSGHFEMHAAGVGGLRPVDRKKRADSANDLVERPRFVAARSLDRIAVHRIAGPKRRRALPFSRRGSDPADDPPPYRRQTGKSR